MELRVAALQVLALPDPAAKAAAARVLPDTPGASLDPGALLHQAGDLPGRPERPALLAHTALARRSPFTTGGRAALLHAVAHIEFNAIKIGLTVDIS